MNNIIDLEQVFVVLLDNSSSFWNSSKINILYKQILSSTGNKISKDNILFLLVTDDTDRDKDIISDGLNIWLINSKTRKILIFENQNDDFFGLRKGIDSAINDTLKSKVVKTFRVRSEFPYVTAILIAVNVIYFIIMSFNGNVDNTDYVIQMGGNYSPLVFENHEFWRLITCMFVHFSLFHLAGNMVYLGIVGFNFERIVGHVRFLLIYLLSGLGASIISAGYYQITDQNTVSAGASGAIYGLIAMTVYLTFKFRSRTGSSALFLRIGIILVFLFYSNFANSDGVDVVAHIGGFAFGILLSFLLIEDPFNKKRRIK